MKTINKRNFGTTIRSIKIYFNDGTSVIPGYIVNQLSWCNYRVTADGINFYDVELVRTNAEAASLRPGDATVKVELPNNAGTTFVRRIYSKQCVLTDGRMIRWSTGRTVADHMGRLHTYGIDVDLTSDDDDEATSRYFFIGL